MLAWQHGVVMLACCTVWSLLQNKWLQPQSQHDSLLLEADLEEELDLGAASQLLTLSVL